MERESDEFTVEDSFQGVTMFFTSVTGAQNGELIAFLDEHAGQPEVPVFRPFVESMWKKNPERWGEIS